MKPTKILFISNVAGRKVGAFSLASIMAAKSMGIEFHMAANYGNSSPEQRKLDEERYGITLHHIDFIRNPLNVGNQKAYEQVIALIKREGFDAIHCNTPVGGVIGRMAGKKCGVKKIIYQAHGFHFYKGGPLLNWLLYYPVERWLARETDVLITINREDYELARSKFRLRGNGRVYWAPGVGIDLKQYTVAAGASSAQKRAELQIPQDAFALISVGELNANKNNSIIIMALERLQNDRVHLVLCGIGNEQRALQEQADRAGLHDRVHFLGYRADVRELYHAVDCFVSASLREGLPRSTMEAMASGLPCVASRIRGNVDLLSSSSLLFDPCNADELCSALEKAMDKKVTDKEIRENSREIMQFSAEKAIQAMQQIYRETFH